MDKPIRIILGIATLWPIFYIALFFLFIFSQIFLFSQQKPPSFGTFFTMFILHFLTMILVIALLIIYIVDLFRNDRVQKDMKPLWAIVILLGGIIAMPIYWYLYIWREPKEINKATSPKAT